MKKGLLFIIILVFGACTEESHTPKPRMYPKVDFPEKDYQLFNKPDCPFTFEFPLYSEVQKDSLFFDQKPVNDCWFDIYFKSLNCRFYMSYYNINNPSDFENLRADVFKMAGKVNQRSNYMEEIKFKNKKGVSGLVFEYEGPAASQMQFFLSDTTSHFFRGAMYFHSHVVLDSLAPISVFIKDDLRHLLETFDWKD